MSNAHESHHFVCFLLANVFSTLQDNKQVELKNTILFSKKLCGGIYRVYNRKVGKFLGVFTYLS